jgi:hypothetical protein
MDDDNDVGMNMIGVGGGRDRRWDGNDAEDQK